MATNPIPSSVEVKLHIDVNQKELFIEEGKGFPLNQDKIFIKPPAKNNLYVRSPSKFWTPLEVDSFQ